MIIETVFVVVSLVNGERLPVAAFSTAQQCADFLQRETLRYPDVASKARPYCIPVDALIIPDPDE